MLSLRSTPVPCAHKTMPIAAAALRAVLPWRLFAAEDGAQASRTSAPPAGKVVVHRDTWGLPPTHARLEADGFYRLGYAIAQDNPEDTLPQHVIARDEMARDFGAAYLEIDRQCALLDVRARAEAALRRLPRRHAPTWKPMPPASSAISTGFQGNVRHGPRIRSRRPWICWAFLSFSR